jgi:hypothetical protein
MRGNNARGPLAFLVALVAVVLLGNFPNARATIVQVSALVLLAIAMSELAARALPRRKDKRWLLDGSLREDITGAHRPNDLVELENAFGWGSYGPRDFTTRVRPLLRELTTYRLGTERPVPPALLAVMDDDAEIPERLTTRDIDRLVDEIEGLR